jgi:putative phage-type endonuclease
MQTATEAIELTEPEWLERRKHGLGASDVITALGYSKWKSQYTLWAEKSNWRKKKPDPNLYPEPVTGLAVELGHFMEPFLRRKYMDETRRFAFDPGEFTIFAHPDLDFLFCTPDALIQYTSGIADDVGPLETKTAGEYQSKDWKDGNAPIAAMCQLQIQMACLGHERGSIAGLIGNREFHWLDVERNDGLINKMLARLTEFWDRVLNDDAPQVDHSVSTQETLFNLHPDDNDLEIEIDETELSKLDHVIKECDSEIKLFEDDRDLAKNSIRELIGPNTFGVCEGIRYSNKTQERKDTIKVSLEVEDLLIEHGIPYERKPGAKFRKLWRCKV